MLSLDFIGVEVIGLCLYVSIFTSVAVALLSTDALVDEEDVIGWHGKEQRA